MDDWRIRYQEDYLWNKTFMFKRISVKDHCHCEFCWEKFCREEEKSAYITLDDSYVVCEKCFEEFKERFKFKIFCEDNFTNKKPSEIIVQEITAVLENSMIFDIEKIEKLSEVLKDIVVSQEKLLLIPAITTFAIKSKPMIKFIDYKIQVQNVRELLETIQEIKNKDFNLFANNKTGRHQRLCLQLRTI